MVALRYSPNTTQAGRVHLCDMAVLTAVSRRCGRNDGAGASMTFRVNGERLNESLRELARIGMTPGGGVTRLAASDEDRAGREQLRAWMEAAGLTVLVDDFGNMTGLRAGMTAEPPIVMASHADTVIRGGKYDGALGVLGAL